METRKTAHLLSLGLAFILILLPFHAFLTTWAASATGHYDLLKIWKEILLAGLLPPAALLLYKDRRLANALFKNPAIILIALYTILLLGLGVWARKTNRVNTPALLYGLIVDLRFFLIFVLAIIAATTSPLLKKYWAKLVLWPSAVVVAFGLVQKFILPANFLEHFGYSQKTIPPYQTVDANIDFRRLQSTLRGANPLGAYLVVALSAGAVTIKKLNKLIIYLVGGFTVLFFSYSRSAWLGLGLSLFVVAFAKSWLKLSNKILALAIAAILVFAAGAFISKAGSNNEALLHTSNNSKSSLSSNAARLTALKGGWHDLTHQPWGRGPGTAGPASVRNNHPRIAENYYLQIGQEAGWAGLVIFLAINGVAAMGLWRERKDPLSLVLLASLIGISFVNLVSHAWTDDTLSLIWWALAGVALAPVILAKKAIK